MDVETLADGLLRYVFPPDPGTYYGYSVYALIDRCEGTATLLDAANEPQAAAVRDALDACGIQISRVVLSHFHHDHIFGLDELQGVEILGSPAYQETLKLLGEPSQWKTYTPTQTVLEGETITIGPWTLRFLDAPGHSVCSRYTLIDESFVHVGDNLMAANDGRPILPWVEAKGIAEHIRSLETLEAFADRTLLPSHGPPLRGKETILSALADRVSYLQALIDSGLRVPFEGAPKRG